ncbi:MAG: hypothetical protein JWQ55_6101 [Rhodopila sp.]|nr:hypothetical protein [Rhodopila sp.]
MSHSGVTFFYSHGLVDDRQGDFSFEGQAVLVELVAQALVVDGLAGAQGSMHLDGQADDAFGQEWAGFWGSGLWGGVVHGGLTGWACGGVGLGDSAQSAQRGRRARRGGAERAEKDFWLRREVFVGLGGFLI